MKKVYQSSTHIQKWLMGIWVNVRNVPKKTLRLELCLENVLSVVEDLWLNPRRLKDEVEVLILAPGHATLIVYRSFLKRSSQANEVTRVYINGLKESLESLQGVSSVVRLKENLSGLIRVVSIKRTLQIGKDFVLSVTEPMTILESRLGKQEEKIWN